MRMQAPKSIEPAAIGLAREERLFGGERTGGVTVFPQQVDRVQRQQFCRCDVGGFWIGDDEVVV